jgi:acetyl-CoA decarbonylase/synthase complex subunit gamma
MQLAKKAIPLDKCPFVTPEVRAVLEQASQPAIRLVEIGSGEAKSSIGNETVLFRHEEKFHHPTAIGFILEDVLSESELNKAIEEINKCTFERVGQKIEVNLVALKETKSKDSKFINALKILLKKTTLGLVLMPKTTETLKTALEICASQKPLVYCSENSLLDSFATIAGNFRVPLAFRGSSVSELSSLTKKIVSRVPDIVLDVHSEKMSDYLWQLTQLRRLSIKKNERSVGFPTMVIADLTDEAASVVEASMFIAKYASIVLLKTRKPEYVLPLLTLRQNIFTDPQKPLQVEPAVYTIGAADDRSPVLITTNFSLTYYTVLGEIETSRIPSHLICVDTEGMSVLTAWAAEKFNAEKVADTLIKFKLEEKVRHKNLIIPGYVSMMSGDLEEKSGWKILVGPREAAGLPSYLKNL